VIFVFTGMPRVQSFFQLRCRAGRSMQTARRCVYQDLKDKKKAKSISRIDIYKHTLFPRRAGVGLHSFQVVRWLDRQWSSVGVRFSLEGSFFRKANSRYRPVVSYLKAHTHSSAMAFLLSITRHTEIQGFPSSGKYFPPHPVVS
jgi:hypothetical protein